MAYLMSTFEILGMLRWGCIDYQNPYPHPSARPTHHDDDTLPTRCLGGWQAGKLAGWAVMRGRGSLRFRSPPGEHHRPEESDGARLCQRIRTAPHHTRSQIAGVAFGRHSATFLDVFQLPMFPLSTLPRFPRFPHASLPSPDGGETRLSYGVHGLSSVLSTVLSTPRTPRPCM